MTKDDFVQSLRAFHKRDPFEPFFIELISGVKLLVGHPDALMGHGRIAAFIAQDGEITIVDHRGAVRFSSDLSEIAGAA